MSTDIENTDPVFYTVQETAELFRVNPVTLYRAIRDDGFPAVKIRKRYVVPAVAVRRIITAVADSGAVVDPAELVARQRTTNEVRRSTGGEPR